MLNVCSRSNGGSVEGQHLLYTVLELAEVCERDTNLVLLYAMHGTNF